MDIESQDSAIALPTKQFFVSMLTRDISLADAILDLVDNCLDGALRLADNGEVDYAQHFVKITLNAECFLIEDNCGGIPRDIAKNYAFKMGREPDDQRDSDNETIGMYGVGMKRAIFKMGREAKVRTLSGDDAFEVPISTHWLDDKSWDPLPMVNADAATRLTQPGTHVRVSSLYPGVSRHFTNDAFQNELRTAISEHFTVFLQRGLRISVNGATADAVHVEVLVSEQADGPAPYVFHKIVDEVAISIAVGLNTGRGFAPDNDDSPEFERDRSAATAGWTVFCNDRAVIVGDKSRLTGWGDGIPLYHYQFSIITGIIEFRSRHADQLPITTTKRALDTSSDVWLQALARMREGTRIWINYTNAWKNHSRSEQTQYWESAGPVGLRRAIELVSRRDRARKADGRIEFNPQKQKVLPLPPRQELSSRRIVFSRPVEQIRTISKSLLDSYDEKPGVIGEKCFDLVLHMVQRREDAGHE